MTSKRYFISACLLGQKVRYDGQDCLVRELVSDLIPDQYVSLCPEISGGLPTPRPPAEIQNASGRDVLNNHATVIDREGMNVSDAFIQGAYAALALAQEHQVTHAILKANSPSCGSDLIYDGTFTGNLIDGDGITAKLLKENGIEVITEEDI